MAVEYFNSFGGFSAGIPPVPVVDANGNVITNVNTTGNVFANVVYATYYKWANGQPLSLTPGGSNTQLQFNNNGSFGGITGVTWNGNVLSLGNVSALKIGGGTDGYFLQTDGTGNLTWTEVGGGGNTLPGGSNTEVQFNNAGVFGGAAGFTFDRTSNTLTVSNINITSNFTGNISGSSITGPVAFATTANAVAGANVSGVVANATYATSAGSADSVAGANVSGQVSYAVIANSVAGANVSGVVANATYSVSAGSADSATTAGTVTTNAQPNITSVGTLTSIAVSGTSNLGPVGNITITGGTNGYVLQTDGSGNLSWTAQSGGGGNGTPGGSNTQVQYNNNGSFGGSQFFTFDETANVVNIAGNLVANSIQMGSGIYEFYTSSVFAATTNNTLPDQVIYSVLAANLAGLDFTIISTDSLGSKRQITKLSIVTLDGMLSYNDTSTIAVSDYISDFSVDYNPGNVSIPPKVELKVTPASGNLTVHKMQITTFKA